MHMADMKLGPVNGNFLRQGLRQEGLFLEISRKLHAKSITACSRWEGNWAT